MYEWYQEEYVGAAHGLAGIYYYLMQVNTFKTTCFCCICAFKTEVGKGARLFLNVFNNMAFQLGFC